jgi:hypothetical protein
VDEDDDDVDVVRFSHSVFIRVGLSVGYINQRDRYKEKGCNIGNQGFWGFL